MPAETGCEFSCPLFTNQRIDQQCPSKGIKNPVEAIDYCSQVVAGRNSEVFDKYRSANALRKEGMMTLMKGNPATISDTRIALSASFHSEKPNFDEE